MKLATRKFLPPLKRIRNFLTPLALVPAVILPLIVCSGAAASEDAKNYSTFVLYFENDLFGNTDEYYTSAFKLSWISKGFADSGTSGGPPEWLRWLAAKMPTGDRKDLYHFGCNLPADFGSSLITPGGGTVAPVRMQDPRLAAASHFGVTFFAGVDGRAVARNIFLDGNTFCDSASVDKNYLVADISAGVSVIFKKFKLTYTQVYRTEEFQGQDGGELFGSINLAYTF
jgi:hypothetical protein